MDKEEIKDYLKRADELELKLTGEDKDTYQWILFGYNQCAKLLNETEQQCEKQKEVIDRAKTELEQGITFCQNDSQGLYDKCNIAINREQRILNILKEVE